MLLLNREGLEGERIVCSYCDAGLGSIRADGEGGTDGERERETDSERGIRVE